MSTSSCLSDEQLTPLVAGEAPSAGAAEHLEQCADCRQRLRRLEREINTVRQVYGELTSGGYWLDSKDAAGADRRPAAWPRKACRGAPWEGTCSWRKSAAAAWARSTRRGTIAWDAWWP